MLFLLSEFRGQRQSPNVKTRSVSCELKFRNRKVKCLIQAPIIRSEKLAPRNTLLTATWVIGYLTRFHKSSDSKSNIGAQQYCLVSEGDIYPTLALKSEPQLLDTSWASANSVERLKTRLNPFDSHAAPIICEQSCRKQTRGHSKPDSFESHRPSGHSRICYPFFRAEGKDHQRIPKMP